MPTQVVNERTDRPAASVVLQEAVQYGLSVEVVLTGWIDRSCCLY